MNEQMSAQRRTQIIKSLAVLTLLAVIAVIHLWPTTSSSYPISIFDAFPVGFELLVYTAFLASILLIASGVYDHNRRTARAGIAAYLAWIALFYIIPTSRGYFYGSTGADSFHHLGIVRTVLESGAVPADDFYPAVKTLSATTVIVTDGALPMQSLLLSIVFHLLLLVGVSLLARHYWGWQAAMAAFLVASPFVFGKFHRALHPFFYSFVLFPLYLLLFDRVILKDVRRGLKIVFGTLLVVLPFFHPLTTLFLIGVLGVYYLAVASYTRLENTDRIRPTIFPVLLLTTLMAWIIYKASLLKLAVTAALANVMDTGSGTSSGSEGESIVDIFITAFTTTQISLAELVWDVVIGSYGAPLLYLGIGAIIVLYIAVQVYRGLSSLPEYVICAEFVAGGLVGVSLLVGYAVIANPIRAFRVALLFSIPLMAVVVWRFAEDQKPAVYTAAVILVAVAGVISIGMVYSPATHTSTSTVEGVGWSAEYQSTGVPTESHIDRKTTFFVLGYQEARNRPVLFTDTPPRNLGYGDVRRMSDRIDGEAYIVLTGHDLKRHLSVSEERAASYPWVVTRQNRERLSNDPSAQMVYDSGQYWVWTMRST